MSIAGIKLLYSAAAFIQLKRKRNHTLVQSSSQHKHRKMSSLTDLDIETQAVVLSAIINGATGCVYLILFEYCRSQNKVVYEPRKFSHKYKTCSDDLSGFLNWVSGALSIPVVQADAALMY